MDIAYIDAWHLWLIGDDIRGDRLWGLEIFWWARLSKILGLLAALTIVLDIVGSSRLRKFALSLNPEPAWSMAFEKSGKLFRLLSTSAARFFDDTADDDPTIFHFLVVSIPFVLSIACTTALGSRLLYLLSDDINWTGFWLAAATVIPLVIILTCIFAFVLLFAFFATGVLLSWCIGAAVYAIMFPLFSLIWVTIEVCVFVLSHPRLALHVRLLSLVLILAAFHFDFLAS